MPRFINHGDGRVTDKLTGLMWTQDSDAPGPGVCNPGGAKNWSAGLQYVGCLNAQNYLGHNDWRLPNKNELRSLFDYSQANPALPLGHPFLNVLKDDTMFWTSTAALNAYTVSADIGVVKYIMSFHQGIYDVDWGMEGNPLRVWPVRTAELASAEAGSP